MGGQWRSSRSPVLYPLDIAVEIYEALTPQCGRSVVHLLFVRVDIGVVTDEAMTPHCRSPVVQVLVVRVDIGVVVRTKGIYDLFL